MLEVQSLDDIGVACGTDKSSLFHDFLNFYERNLNFQRDEKLRICEIGVYDGASLNMWSTYYPNSTVVGLDINPSCLKYAVDNKIVVIGDQSNIDHIVNVALRYGPFDLIIDDGSHFWDHQIVTFQYLYPFLKSGGYYILEDIDTSLGSYAETYSNGSGTSALDYVKKMLDYMIGDRVLNVDSEKDLFVRSFSRTIQSCSFFRRTCVMRRAL